MATFKALLVPLAQPALSVPLARLDQRARLAQPALLARLAL